MGAKPYTEHINAKHMNYSEGIKIQSFNVTDFRMK
jgi:hypothetical protein